MTYAPPELRALSVYWTQQGGVSLGIVGDARHVIGYHCGEDRIYSAAGRGDDDYSVQQPRDKAGLTDAAAAIDLGRLNGSLGELYEFSKWLVAACQAGDVGSRDVREIIYSPDGVKVQRYSGVDGQIHTGPGNGDASHIGHTHISYFRDSENREKLTLFAPYWEDDVPTKQAPITDTTAKEITLSAGRNIYDLDGVTVLYQNKVARDWRQSPYGVLIGGKAERRAMYFDAGEGEDPRVVLVVPSSVRDVPASGAPLTLTGEGVTYRREEPPQP